MIKIKRVYESPAKDDGLRVLVDRIWPRGLSKEEAAVDRWMKEIAPSGDLRKWFGHDPKKWEDFQQRYKRELDDHQDGIAFLKEKSRDTTVTLLYAAKDTEHNNAVALKDYLS